MVFIDIDISNSFIWWGCSWASKKMTQWQSCEFQYFVCASYNWAIFLARGGMELGDADYYQTHVNWPWPCLGFPISDFRPPILSPISTLITVTRHTGINLSRSGKRQRGYKRAVWVQLSLQPLLFFYSTLVSPCVTTATLLLMKSLCPVENIRDRTCCKWIPGNASMLSITLVVPY